MNSMETNLKKYSNNQTNNNFIVFDSNRLFKSKLLSCLIESLDLSAWMILIKTILYIIATTAGFQQIILMYESPEDLLFLIFISFIIVCIFKMCTITKIDTTTQTLYIQNPSTFTMPIKKDIKSISKIIVFPHNRYRQNIIILTTSTSSKKSTSIREYTQFVKLLQELNPSIEVEYKE